MTTKTAPRPTTARSIAVVSGTENDRYPTLRPSPAGTCVGMRTRDARRGQYCASPLAVGHYCTDTECDHTPLGVCDKAQDGCPNRVVRNGHLCAVCARPATPVGAASAARTPLLIVVARLREKVYAHRGHTNVVFAAVPISACALILASWAAPAVVGAAMVFFLGSTAAAGVTYMVPLRRAWRRPRAQAAVSSTGPTQPEDYAAAAGRRHAEAATFAAELRAEATVRG